MLVESSYTTKAKPRSVLSLSLRKKNYQADAAAPTDKKTSFQPVLCSLRRRRSPGLSRAANPRSGTRKYKGVCWLLTHFLMHHNRPVPVPEKPVPVLKALRTLPRTSLQTGSVSSCDRCCLPPLSTGREGKRWVQGMAGAERMNTHFNH